jgi:hypothetical protein
LLFQSSIIYLFSAIEGSGEAISVNVVLRKTTQKKLHKLLKEEKKIVHFAKTKPGAENLLSFC